MLGQFWKIKHFPEYIRGSWRKGAVCQLEEEAADRSHGRNEWRTRDIFGGDSASYCPPKTIISLAGSNGDFPFRKWWNGLRIIEENVRMGEPNPVHLNSDIWPQLPPRHCKVDRLILKLCPKYRTLPHGKWGELEGKPVVEKTRLKKSSQKIKKIKWPQAL